MNSLNSSKFKSTKRYRRRKVRENNKNKYGIDKNLNHQVTQKVWRLPGGPREKQQQQQQQQQQEKDKNMHSMTSRHQERKGRQERKDDNDITKVKTLQDATLKASRLYGMMRDFIHPSKINYRKIHSKWRNVKKQVQVGGIEPGTGTGPEAVPVDDKDCLELPPKLSLHVTQDPLNPKQFIVTKKDGDPLINGSLTTFAEGLMGHLDKIKSGIEIDIGDADILALIAHDLISIILDVLDSDEDDDDGGDKAQKLKAALDRESRNAAAAAIIIALIGLIKKKDGDDGSNFNSPRSSSDSDGSFSPRSEFSDDRSEQLLAEIERLGQELRDTNAYLRQLQGVNRDNQRLQDQIGDLTRQLQTVNDQFAAWNRAQVALNAANLLEVRGLQARNQHLQTALQGIGQENHDLQNQLAETQDQNGQLNAVVGRLRQALQDSQRQNAERLDRLNALNQQLQQQETVLRAQIAALQQTETQQQTTIARQTTLIKGLVDEDHMNKARLSDARQQLVDAQEAGQQENQALQADVQRLTREKAEKDAELAASQKKLSDDHAALQQTRAQILELQGENRHARAENLVLQEQHRRTQTELESARQNAQELEQQISTARSETAAEQAKKVQLEQWLGAQRLHIRKLTDTFNREKAELGDQNDAQQRELAELQSKHTATEQALASATQRSRELADQLESLNDEKSAEGLKFAEELRDANAEKERLSEKSQEETLQLQLLNSRLGAQAEEIRAKDAQIRQTVQEAEKAKRAAESEAYKQQQAVGKATSELAALRADSAAQLAALEAQHNTTTSQLQAARADVLELTGRLDALRGIHSEEAVRLQSEIEAQQKEVRELTSKSQVENAALQKAIQDKDVELRNQKAASEAQIVALQQEQQERLRIQQQQLNEKNERAKLEHGRQISDKNEMIEKLKQQLQAQQERERQQELQAQQEREAAAAAAANQDRLAREAAAAAQQRFDKDKQPLSRALTDVMKSIAAMKSDDPCKLEFQRDADEIGVEISILTPKTIDSKKQNLDFRMKNLSESTGTKIRTYVAMRGGEDDGDDSGITFDTENKTVTTPGRDVPWGAFSGVFDRSKTNEAKYTGMLDILSPIPDGNTVVIFGYGYSGSGKTYTLLGGKDKKSDLWDKGIAERAIDDYEGQSCTVDLEEAFEMYNDSYNVAGGNNYFYGRRTSKISYLSQSQSIKNITSREFRDECSRIDAARKKSKHIKPTTNNDKSSRGHLFIQLKVTRPGERAKVGRLIICDMGGRENPNEMWTSGQYCTSKKDGVLGPIVKIKSTHYYDSDGEATECVIGNTEKSTDEVFDNPAGGLGGALQAVRLSKQQADILETLKQGFYINDSINEILKEFGYDFKDKKKEGPTNWKLGKAAGSDYKYFPDIRALSVAGYKSDPATYKPDEDKIGIRKIFKTFKDYGKCKIKFCTFACIRSPKKVLSDSIATLEFATAVNSCVNPVSVVSLPPVKEQKTAAAGVPSQQLNDRRLLTPAGLFITSGNKGGMSSRKNKRAIHNSTLKANVNAKVKSSHVREKRKSTTRKHRKSIKNNKNNKRTIKNRVEKMK